MIYVLEVYSYQSNKIYQMMYSENSIKLEKFVDLAREYHINWNYCEQTFREFCTGRRIVTSSATAPVLNDEFIKCVPRKDVFAAPSEPAMIISFGNLLKAIGPIPVQ